jgi:hypothetical protein
MVRISSAASRPFTAGNVRRQNAGRRRLIDIVASQKAAAAARKLW